VQSGHANINSAIIQNCVCEKLLVQIHSLKNDLAEFKAVVYGLSTEGYEIASILAKKNAQVAIIDELQGSAITIRSEIARTYSNVTLYMKKLTAFIH